MESVVKERARHEIEHGRMLAENDPETIWGWGTPAGKRRAHRRTQLISAGAGLRPGLRVLEIGCGSGNFSERFASLGIDLTACDISPELLVLANERKLPADRVRFVEARFEDLSSAQPFDAIIGSSVLHHLEIEPALANIHRLLKPGGTLCFAEPNMVNPQVHLMFKYQWAKKRWGVSPDERAFYRWPLQDRLRQAGFEDVRVRPFDFLHPITPKLLIKPVECLGIVMEHLPLFREIAGSLCLRARKPL